MVKKLLTVVLIVALTVPMFLNLSVSAYNGSRDTDISFNSCSSGDKISGSLEYIFGDVHENRSSPYSKYYYSDAYFLSKSTVYNSHLATMSLVSSLSYDRPWRFFSEIGFSEIATNYDTDGSPTPNTIGVVMAQKKIIENGKPYTLVSIIIRGGGYYSEWANNFLVGSGEDTNGNHKGFYQSRNRALVFIRNYIKENVEGDTKLWITGYSRGGAVAGLIGAWFDDNCSNLSELGINLLHENIFTYTFESPATTDKKNLIGKKYGNIFNSVSENDIIPRLPFSGYDEGGWSFERPGVYKPYADIDKSDVPALEEIARIFKSDTIYDINNFTSALAGLGNTQARFLDKFVENATKRLSRKDYAEKIEGPLVEIMSNLMSKSGSEYDRTIGKFASGVAFDLGLNAAINIQWVNKLISWMSNGEDASRSLVSILGKNLERSEIIDEYDKEVEVFLEAFVDFLFKGESNDIQMFYFVFNIISNTVTKEVNGQNVTQNRIMAAHDIWLTMAIQMFNDNYYQNVPSGFTDHDYRGTDNIAEVSVNVGGTVHSAIYYTGDKVEISAKIPPCKTVGGWYVDGKKISSDKTVDLVATSDISLELRLDESHSVITDWITEREATEELHGKKYKMCAECGARIEEARIPKLYSDTSEDLQGIGLDSALPIAAASVSLILVLSIVITVILRCRKPKENKPKLE